MNIFEVIFQSIIQGVTEFLPVSSSGHLSVFQYITGSSGHQAVLFSLILHLGTLVAVFIAFRKKILKLIVEFFVLIKDIFTGKFKWTQMNGPRRMIIMIVISLIPMLFFYLIKDIYVSVGADNDIVVEGLCFLFTAFILFVADRCTKGHKQDKDITVKDALIIGTFQGIAPLPGISRSGSTISSGLLCGLSRETAVEFSFIMGIPAILGGSLLELKDIGESNFNISFTYLVIGFLISAVVGFLCIKLISYMIKSDKFQIFIYYTFVLGILVVVAGVLDKFFGLNLFAFLK